MVVGASASMPDALRDPLMACLAECRAFVVFSDGRTLSASSPSRAIRSKRSEGCGRLDAVGHGVMVAALFVQSRGVYSSLGVEVFDVHRDARTFDLACPVVAHPPCRGWGRLRHLARPRADEWTWRAGPFGSFVIAAVSWNTLSRLGSGRRSVFELACGISSAVFSPSFISPPMGIAR